MLGSIALRFARNRRRTLLSLLIVGMGAASMLLVVGFVRQSFDGLREAIIEGGVGHRDHPDPRQRRRHSERQRRAALVRRLAGGPLHRREPAARARRRSDHPVRRGSSPTGNGRRRSRRRGRDRARAAHGHEGPRPPRQQPGEGRARRRRRPWRCWASASRATSPPSLATSSLSWSPPRTARSTPSTSSSTASSPPGSRRWTIASSRPIY